ncbi:MAG: EamA family transporter RarD [Pseudonocardiales bacterium]|nr:EamA family transporter RarD [Pseudonocardiales bacterium]
MALEQEHPVAGSSPNDPVHNEPVLSDRGLIYGVAAYLLWGLFPLYWPLLEPAGAIEILSMRMLFSLVVVVALLSITHTWDKVAEILRTPAKRWRLLIAAIFVSVNWGVYIWGVNSEHVIETSLGYFINPLFTILLGVVLLGERLRRTQWIAVSIAGLAIVVLTVDYGRLPWIALTLALSFGTYGYQKKRAQVGAVESLAVETGFMALPAAITVAILAANGSLVFGAHPGNSALLAGTGVVTAIPLLFFGAAARRLPLSTLGLIQYLAPVLQFAVGVGIRHEPLPPARLAGFSLVWLALIILSVDGLRNQRRGAAGSAKGQPPAQR